MRLASLRALTLVTMGAVLAAAAPSTPLASIEQDARAFLAGYAKDLQEGNRLAIIDRYHPQGHYVVKRGKKRFLTQALNRAHYLDSWNPPTSFAWKDLSYEPLSPGAIVIIGAFDWGLPTGKTVSMSYTGLLVKVEGRLKIRLEDECVEADGAK